MKEDLEAAAGGVAQMKLASLVLPRPNWQSYVLTLHLDTGSWLKAYKSAKIRATMKGESFMRLTMSLLEPAEEAAARLESK